MKVELKNANDNKGRFVEVGMFDKVKIIEWDGITVRGFVSFISEEKIEVNNAEFLDGCYREGNYSEVEKNTEFSFILDDLFSIEVATIDQTTPISLMRQAGRDNYCGSEGFVMSPMFYNWYKSYVQDYRLHHSYAGQGITIDENLQGMSVYAIPNEKSIKHKISPYRCYNLKFYSKGKWIGTHIVSCFEDELEERLVKKCQKFKMKTGIQQFAYKLTLDGKILERGNGRQRYKIAM